MWVLIPSSSDILENLPERIFSQFCFKWMPSLTSFLKNKCCLWGRGAWCLRGTRGGEKETWEHRRQMLTSLALPGAEAFLSFPQHHHPKLLVPTVWMSLLFLYFLASCPFAENYPRSLMFCSAARFPTCCREIILTLKQDASGIVYRRRGWRAFTLVKGVKINME